MKASVMTLSGGQGIRTDAENTGIPSDFETRETNTTRKAGVRNFQAPENERDSTVDRALKAIAQSRQEVQKLLDATRRDEHYQLSLLGPILVNLKDAQSVLENLG